MKADPTKRLLYFNHAGTSWPKPGGVMKAVREAMSIPPFQWPQRFEEAHVAIADFFGVNRPEQILLTPGCTSALAIGVSDILIPAGHRVLTSRWEHHAVHRPLLKLASSGVQVDYIPVGQELSNAGSVVLLDLNWLEDQLAHQDVGLVAITAACNVTGELLPYEEVIRLAHRYGAKVLIDAAQIVGWQRLDLIQLGADLVAFGGHKGLQAPWGIGGLYLCDQVQMECVSATCGMPVAGHSGTHRVRPSYCDVGSVNQHALLGLHAAMKELNQRNEVVDLQRGRQQIKRIREALVGIEHLQICGGNGNGMPTLAVEVPGLSSTAVATHLLESGVGVGCGHQCASLAHETLGTLDVGLVRLSVGVGQPDDEIDEAVGRLSSAFSNASLSRLRTERKT